MAHSATEPLETDYVVLVDTGELQPWTFDGMRANANKQHRPLVVRTLRANLGRHPDSKGDYSLEGFDQHVGVERKSLEDCISTVLGWDSPYERREKLSGHRERFEKELDNLSKLEAACVIVEASLGDCLAEMPSYGKKSRELNQISFHRSIIAYGMDYRGVQWHFCPDRRLAEITCLRFLERFYRKWKEANRR